ncbi:EAL domain-containing protein [Rhodococcus sp. BP-349]|nr:EAL domain-containing protein [Rhodococcus sp. BP-363]MBY6542179.1 EAL domain-containing protein [Rhodococcus sp. BP-369]MBY6561409.1 EAL domain-containing protein [Rhodococcus sp. BP-370]MBY6575701.1 EAL domain-containing protein [Rhodococcus sp. BP-364]MBY6585002.1 EAL domain-containing protein [Rhodococcus sp. BP-358]MBY6589339.1 EAL domain-containing protein [Rhodococcus sp. BP-362]MBY6594128.1 EAL domain-containing protein [Rhodococcus sp. BP-359]MBY6598015.1 EAL domain-containing pr
MSIAGHHSPATSTGPPANSPRGNECQSVAGSSRRVLPGDSHGPAHQLRGGVRAATEDRHFSSGDFTGGARARPPTCAALAVTGRHAYGEHGQQSFYSGVETDAELRTVRRLGAHFLQGYHLGRPAPAADGTTPPK